MMVPGGPGDAHAREIAAGLVAAVRAALATRAGDVSSLASPLAWSAAADVADLLELQGLASLLAACAATSASPSPRVTQALERIARLADQAEASGELGAFASADRELAALATSSGFTERPAAVAERVPASSAAPVNTPPAAPQGTAPDDVRSLAALLADFTFDDPAGIAKAVVSLPVAAGLRAALDWIAAETSGRLHVEVQDAALTLVARAVYEPGLGAAGAVLGLTGGALLPEPDGRWALRVPLHAQRPAFLLARQGDLSLALPWHSVARLKLTDEASRAAMTEPSLAPWSALARGGSGERPAALVALGLSRAWLHLDHIVWRVFARPEPAEAVDAVPGGRLVIRTDEGEEYRVIDVEQALQGVPPLHTPPPMPRMHRAPAAPVAPDEAPISLVLEPGPAAVVITQEPATVAALPAAAPAEPIVLGPESVRALGLQPLPAAAPMAAAPRPAASSATAPPPSVPAVPRALVVDDSLVARMELGRVLERFGWEVEWVETAAEMWSALPESAWSVVFVDVSLPDARGRAHLKTLAGQQRSARDRFEVVALTRDEADERLVVDVGIVRMLRKPFAAGAIERVVKSLRGGRA